MGTSDAYGGSGRQAWQDAGDALADLASDAPSATEADQDDSDVEDFWQGVADALAGEDPSLTRPLPADDPFPLPTILPRRGAGGGGGTGGAGALGAPGGQGGGSGRSVTRSAARGGAAIGGAYALQAGDAAALAELGLNLNELRGVSPRMQCARILQAILGDAAHPDEAALQRAAAEQLKAILMSDQPPAEEDAIRGFVARFVFELMLVELQDDLTSGNIDMATAHRKERRVWGWLEARVRSIRLPDAPRIAASQLREMAARITQEAIRILRPGRQPA